VESDFTSDRDQLKQAIFKISPGQGTSLYDAVQLALERLKPIKGRKAIVLFTDGVDTTSIRGRYDETIMQVEESNALVYSIRYDTIEAVRRAMRNPTGRGTTARIPLPPEHDPNPTPPTQRVPGPGQQPWPQPSPYPQPTPGPFPAPFPGPWPTPQPGPVPGDPSRMPRRTPPQMPSEEETLEMDYERGGTYLWELATRTGGARFEARTIGDTSEVFKRVADELRHQYTLGYVPTNPPRDGKYRRIRVKVNRDGARAQARPGYWANQ
jgi:VWFA-related protein